MCPKLYLLVHKSASAVQAPFYPGEASSKGLTASQFGPGQSQTHCLPEDNLTQVFQFLESSTWPSSSRLQSFQDLCSGLYHSHYCQSPDFLISTSPTKKSGQALYSRCYRLVVVCNPGLTATLLWPLKMLMSPVFSSEYLLKQTDNINPADSPSFNSQSQSLSVPAQSPESTLLRRPHK